MCDRALPDQAARDRILTDLDASLLVEGGAGSGKTRSLTDRMLALIRSGRATPFNMAAVTFTRKAAAELRERFQIELERALAAGGPPDGAHEKLQHALTNLEHCFIGTIHSFCARLIRERPVEVGIDPAFEEVEDQEEERIRAEFWDQHIQRLRESDAQELKTLEELDVSPGDLLEALSRIAAYPDVETVPQPVPKPKLRNARAALEKLLQFARDVLPDEEPDKGWDDVQTVFRRLLRRRSLFAWDDDRVFLRALALFEPRSAANVTQIRWEDKPTALKAKRLAGAFRDEHALPVLAAWREYRHAGLLTVIRPAAENYALHRRQIGRLNFQDLLMLAAKLLREHPAVRRYFAERFQYLLVDEYQDTDPVQAEVMFLLAADDPEETDWTQCRLRPGALFVVGDPKQSIYRFRRADIDTYNTTRMLMGGEANEARLTANFRTIPSIGEFVNLAFRGSMPAEASRHQAAFAPVEAVRPDPDPSWNGVLRLSIPKVSRNGADAIAEADAEAIASWIAWACDGNLEIPDPPDAGGDARPAVPSDFLILLRYTHKLAVYGSALERKGVPFEVSGAGSLANSREFREVIKLLRCIAEPDDPVRLVAALRGLCFGIDDDTLYRFRRAAGRFSLLSDHEVVTFDEDGALHDALRRLKQYWLWAHRLPPELAIEQIIEACGILPLAASAAMGESTAGSVFKAIEAIRALSAEGVTSFFDAVDLLDELATGAEEGPLFPGRGDAVRLMNLHKAKGMEAPVVFLANPSGALTHSPSEHVDRTTDPAQGHFLITRPKGRYGTEILAQPPGWDQKAAEEDRYRQAEEARLLYVAATRARDILVVSHYDAKPEKSPWYSLEAWLGDGKLALLDEPDRSRPELRARALGLKRRLRDTEQRKRRAIEPGYARESVTSMAKDVPEPPRAETGDGMSWGRAVHRVMQVVGAGLPQDQLEPVSSSILADEGRPAEEVARLVALVEAILLSPFWDRVQKAEHRLVEVPYGLQIEGADGATPTILRGVADLVFHEDGGWVIVDYKSDTIGEGGLEPFARAYEPQLRAYAKHWAELTGEPVKSCYLFFTDRMEPYELQVLP